MNPLQTAFFRCTLLVILSVIVIALSRFLPFAGADSSIVSSVQDNQASETGEERQLGVGVPKHIPIKIKSKNINSKKWSHDLEIEVTNNSDKPIYYLSFMVVIQGIKSPEGKEYMFWVHYGRAQLNDFTTTLESTDRPLMPNESCVLKIEEAEANGWEATRSKLNKPQPSRVGLVFQMLNFGDGTGYANAQGRFFDIHRRVGLDRNCLSPPKKFIARTEGVSFLPAVFRSVNFFTPVEVPEAPCCESGCDYVKQSFYTCTQECTRITQTSLPTLVCHAALRLEHVKKSSRVSILVGVGNS